MKVMKTELFAKWFAKLDNQVAKAAISARITKIQETGSPGSYKRYGQVSEFRFDIGPGYRVYFTLKGDILVILLLGGDKRRQNEDFKRANELVKLVKRED